MIASFLFQVDVMQSHACKKPHFSKHIYCTVFMIVFNNSLTVQNNSSQVFAVANECLTPKHTNLKN